MRSSPEVGSGSTLSVTVICVTAGSGNAAGVLIEKTLMKSTVIFLSGKSPRSTTTPSS